jgi:hypothetical protein
MPNQLAEVKDTPSHELYTLEFRFEQDKFSGTETRPIVRAFLTDKAKSLGVRFTTGGGGFDIAKALGHDGKGNWIEGKNFHVGAKNFDIIIVGTTRFLIADLPLSTKPETWKEKVPYNLDDLLGLSSFWHARHKERYYKLGFREARVSCTACHPMIGLTGLLQRTLVLCFDGTSNHFSNTVCLLPIIY